MIWSSPVLTSKTPALIRPRPRCIVSCRAVRDGRTLANYQDLVHKLSKLNTEQLRTTVESEYTCSSIDFLMWLAEAPLEKEPDHASLGARIMAIREGFNPVTSQDSTKRAIEKTKSAEIEKAEIVALDLDLKSSRARSMTTMIGRRKINNSNDETYQINSTTEIPKRIVQYLLSLQSEEEIEEGVQDAISETVDDHHRRNEDIEFLSTSPIQLIKIVNQWQQQQLNKGYIEELQTPVNLHKLELIKSQILLHFKVS